MSFGNSVATLSRTDVGCVRNNNEDAVAVDTDLGLLVLADGMGGYNAGEVASQMASAIIIKDMRRGLRRRSRASAADDADAALSPAAKLLKHAVERANREIFDAAQARPDCQGMGTTVVAVLLHDNRMTVAHVGDSRLYHWRFGTLRQVTRDHSLVEALVAAGELSRTDAEAMVRKNIVTRALGTDAEVSVDLTEEALEVGDLLLLCSDGLCDMVPDTAMALSLHRHGDDLPAAAEQLIGQALAAGGKDNVSVVLARVDQPFARGRALLSRLLDWI